MRLRESALALASRCSAEILAGRYRLDALVGSGGAADVHRGYDLRLRRAVAVKVFRPGVDVATEDGFGSEAVILARLQHPGLVTAYDAGCHDGRAYLVMQLVEGPTLKARIAEGPLLPEDTAALGAALAQALAHAHESGIVHRDVKPSNILLDASGRPYLTDFGISRRVDATTRTATGTLVGTAAYLAPEQVLGQSVGRPADIYALGLVLLECLTGRLEYDGAPLEAAIARLHRQPVLPGSLPQELALLLRNMTALDQHTRPSALDCARTLAALAGTTPSVPTAPAVNATGFVGSREPVQDSDPTHKNPLPAPERAAAKTAPARNRVLVAGGTVALAAVMAATLAVSDGHQGSDGKATRAVSGAAEKSGPQGNPAGTSQGRARGGDGAAARTPAGTSAGRNDTSATPVAPPSSTHDVSAGLLHAAAPGRSVRTATATATADASVSDGPGRQSADPTGSPHHGTSDGQAQAETKPAAPKEQHARPKKAEKARNEAKEKSEK
ncbi:protein kinase [Streptomyces sp. NPDC048521]|uniref:serine/threonine-protein kinase n=1 Tax=Streptomyces sp. NPDC048521 TaxID=3365566 RepID=UPI00371A75E7